MALKKDITIDGNEYLDAYIAIDGLYFEGKTPDENRKVRSVLLAKRRKEDEYVICHYECNLVYNLSSEKNLWQQAYDAAKLLPELEDSIDV